METVWVVTYPDSSGAPVITVWGDYVSAAEHWEYLKKGVGGLVTLDEAPIYHVFEVIKDGKEEN